MKQYLICSGKFKLPSLTTSSKPPNQESIENTKDLIERLKFFQAAQRLQKLHWKGETEKMDSAKKTWSHVYWSISFKKGRTGWNWKHGSSHDWFFAKMWPAWLKNSIGPSMWEIGWKRKLQKEAGWSNGWEFSQNSSIFDSGISLCIVPVPVVRVCAQMDELKIGTTDRWCYVVCCSHDW